MNELFGKKQRTVKHRASAQGLSCSAGGRNGNIPIRKFVEELAQLRAASHARHDAVRAENEALKREVDRSVQKNIGPALVLVEE